MALNRGSRNPPRCTMSRFLSERDTCLSAALRCADMCFCNLRVLRSHNFILPFSTFNTHSLIQLTSSLLRLVMKALHNLGSAVLSTSRAWKFYFTRLIAYIESTVGRYSSGNMLVRNRSPLSASCVRSKIKFRGAFVSHSGRRYTTREYLRNTLDWPSK